MEIRKIKDIYINYVFPIATIFSAFFYIVFYLCNYMNFGLEWWMTGTKTLRHLAFFCCLLALLRIVLSRKGIEMKLLLLYLCWIMISRLAIDDLKLHQVHVNNWLSVSSCWGIMLCSFFGSCIYLKEKPKKFLIGLLVVFLAGMLGTWALIAIPTALLGRPIVGPQNIFLGTENSIPPLVFISFFRMHRNISATFFVSAMGLTLYQSVASKKIIWKVITVIFLPLSYIAVSLQHSRSNYLTYAIVIALVIMVGVREKIRNRSKILQAVVCMVVAVSCVIGMYASFSVSSDGVVNISHEVRDELEEGLEPILEQQTQQVVQKQSGTQGQEQAEVQGQVQEQTQAQVQEVPVKEISDERSTLKDSSTLTQRSTAWKAAAQVLKEDPKILLFGQPELKLMDKVNAKMIVPLTHMHNFLIQQLMFLGVPGLLIIVAFLILLCRKIILCFLFETGREAKSLKVLSAVLLGLLAYGLFEPILYPVMAFSTTMFFLMAGLFIGKYDELTNSKSEEN